MNLVSAGETTGWSGSTFVHNVATTLTSQNGYFGAGANDNYNLLRGVAAGCNWAGFKVFDNAGNSDSAVLGAALDRLATDAQSNNIVVANVSLSLATTDPVLRSKINQAVSAGVFIAVAAGNDGPAPASIF